MINKNNEDQLQAENGDKKLYQRPVVKAVDISEAIMVAASKSGMGNCKITFF